MELEGIILKGIGGFYYVESAGNVYECKARGIFRKEGIVPLAGDKVAFTVEENNSNTVCRIFERKNFLLRPPVANIDVLFIVASTREPNPSTLVIDRMTAIAEDRGIDCAVVINKTDLGDAQELVSTYRTAGFAAYPVCAESGDGVEAVRAAIDGRVCAFAGNSGVGKSSLLNRIDKRLALSTGEISEKLGRGRHTTREVELFRVGNGYVADTPGFASLDYESGGKIILRDELPFCFREFVPLLGSCKFSTCTHVADSGCKIVKAVGEGKIPVSRHESYVTMYNEVKDMREWELEKAGKKDEKR